MVKEKKLREEIVRQNVSYCVVGCFILATESFAAKSV